MIAQRFIDELQKLYDETGALVVGADNSLVVIGILKKVDVVGNENDIVEVVGIAFNKYMKTYVVTTCR